MQSHPTEIVDFLPWALVGPGPTRLATHRYAAALSAPPPTQGRAEDPGGQNQQQNGRHSAKLLEAAPPAHPAAAEAMLAEMCALRQGQS